MYRYKNKEFESLIKFTEWAEKNKTNIIKDFINLLKESYNFNEKELFKYLYQEQSPIRPRTTCKVAMSSENKEEEWQICNILYLLILLNPSITRIILKN